MGASAKLVEQPLVYRLWQAPFAGRKFGPVLRHNDLRTVGRVLDVGCGPGTNTGYFLDADYVGVDLNGEYVRSARRRYDKEFVVADATDLPWREARDRDFILVNSFLHHVDDEAVRRILTGLRERLAPGGSVHILELVLPERWSVARMLAHLDRGRHARPVREWRRLLAEHFEEVVCEPYRLRALGVTLWNMVYLKGVAREG